MSDKTLSVTQLLRRMKNVLEVNVGEVWVEGEVSNMRKQPSGHWYFTLKDDGAQIACAMFGALRREGSGVLKDGAKVRVFAEATLYEARGTLQIIVLRAEEMGAGALQARFEELKRKLHAEGLFEISRKKALPRYPHRVGFVTSDTGAALQDMLQVLGRRAPWVKPVLISVRVQGRGAELEIAAAIREYTRLERCGKGVCDVLIVGRGGGSLEDLWCFNEEVVARAIFDCPLPVISAVGHEIDFTITDFVADMRAPTPSAAAELVSPDADELRRFFDGMRRRMQNVLSSRIDAITQSMLHLRRGPLGKGGDRLLRDAQTRLDLLRDRYTELASRYVQERFQNVAHLEVRLKSHHPQRWHNAMSDHLALLTPRLQKSAFHLLQKKESELLHLKNLLRTLNPAAPLQRGYSITYDDSGQLLRSVNALAAGSIVTTHVSDGQLTSKVLESKKKGDGI